MAQAPQLAFRSDAVVEAILLDWGTVLPVSSPQSGPNGVSDVSLSVLTVVGRKGVVQQLKAQLSESEQAA